MDPDSCVLLLSCGGLAASLILLFLSCFCAGALLDYSSPSEVQQSGVGLSLRAVSAMLWAFAAAAVLPVCAAAPIRALALLTQTPMNPASAPTAVFYLAAALCYILLFTAAASLCVYLPFSWGKAHSEDYAENPGALIRAASSLVPLARLLTGPARRVIRAKGKTDEVAGVTEEDVLELVDTVEALDVIDENQAEMISNIFELDEVTAADIMTHRTEIEAVEAADPLEDILDIAVRFGYSRIPVFRDTLDNIIGIACVKDLLPYVGRGVTDVGPTDIMRQTVYVPESCRARELLVEFKQKKAQLAVVVDEYGGTAGIVTMEDLLESIVGDIEDEYDEEEQPLIRPDGEGGLMCDGYAEVEDVFEALGLEVPEDIEADTIGGLLTDLLTRIPKPDERPEADFAGLRLTCLGTDGRRITGVHVRPIV